MHVAMSQPPKHSHMGVSALQLDTQPMCLYHTTRGRALPATQIQEGRGAKVVLQLSSTEMHLGPGGLFDGHAGATLAVCLKGLFPHFIAAALGDPASGQQSGGCFLAGGGTQVLFWLFHRAHCGVGGTVLRNTKSS